MKRSCTSTGGFSLTAIAIGAFYQSESHASYEAMDLLKH